MIEPDLATPSTVSGALPILSASTGTSRREFRRKLAYDPRKITDR